MSQNLQEMRKKLWDQKALKNSNQIIMIDITDTILLSYLRESYPHILDEVADYALAMKKGDDHDE